MCVAGNFLHIHQDPDAAAIQAKGRSGEIYRLQIQVLPPVMTHICFQRSETMGDLEGDFQICSRFHI